jgi:hypothetical protein
MAVIYLDQTATGKGGFTSALGQALGEGLSASLQQQQTANAVAAAKNMNPADRMAYLVQKLGPQGAQLADQITKAQVDQSTLSLNALKAVDQGYQNTVDKVAAANAPTTAKLAMQQQQAAVAETYARTIAAKAAAADDMAGAQSAQAQAQLYNVQAQVAQQKFNVLAGTMKAIQALGQSNGDPTQATNTLSNDPHFPGGNNGKLAPQLPGVPKENTDPASAVSQGQAVLGYQLGNMNQQQLNAAFPPDNVTPSITAGNKEQALLGLASGDMKTAGSALNYTKPLSIKMEERAPGIYQNYATYQDGNGGFVGRPIVQLKPTPQKTEQFAEGVDAWQATTQALSVLGQLAPGSRVTRQASNALIKIGIDPTQYGGNVNALYDTALQHANIAARNVAGAGGSIGFKNIQAITDTLPKYTDDANIKAAKLNAANALLDTAVKPAVLGLAANGMVVPPTLKDYFNSRDLLKKDVDALAGEYTIGDGSGEAGNPLAVGGNDENAGQGGGQGGDDSGDGTAVAPVGGGAATTPENDSTSDPFAGFSLVQPGDK